MLINYFKTGWRNIQRTKVYSFINVLGLASGICSCIVIYLITSYEFSFDKFHPDLHRIYRITGEIVRPDGNREFLNSPVPEVAAFEHVIPGFERKAAIHFYDAKVTVQNANQQVRDFNSRGEIIITEPGYFDIFRYQWLAGNQSALSKPYQVVLTESKAHKYFGDIPADRIIGRTITYDDSLQLKVSGIIKDWTDNSDFSYTDFISVSTAPGSFLKKLIAKDDWSSLGPHQSMAFIKIEKGVKPEQVNAQFAAFIKKNVNTGGGKLIMHLQPITDIHFAKEFHRSDDGDDFRKPYLPTLYALIGIAFFILIIAAVNFINLSTAQSIHRAREIGIRKVLGSKRSALIWQFLAETFVLTLIAVTVAIIFINPILSAYSSFIPEGVRFHLFKPSTLFFLLLVTVLTSLFAGFYPAKVLSSYLPVISLKGGIPTGKGTWSLRKALIVFQFTISLIFIIGAIVINNQIRFMLNADKGIKTDAVITINKWRDSGKLKIFAHNIRHIKGVENLILQGTPPMGFAHTSSNFIYKDKVDHDMQVATQIGNSEFISFYKIKLLAGRNITPGDSLRELLINETFSRSLGFARPQQVLGKFLYSNNNPYPVVGVVADFHPGSFHEAIPPVVILNDAAHSWSVAVKLTAENKKNDPKETIAKIENEWKKVYPDDTFEYSYLNESIKWLYDQEQKTAKLVNTAMFITIFISCMGLFGLVMFTAELKTKEIGIRKVLGASIVSITTLLSKDLLRLVIISIIVASPIAWYFMHQWLDDFVYRTSISWWIFAMAAFFAIAIALITVSLQAVKAAMANPVKTLRTE